MDKNTITGFILIALVVIGFSWYSQPSSEELKAMAQRDSIAAQISTGAMNDLERVTKQAYAMVAYAGMSERLSNLCYYNNQEYSFNRPYSEKTAEAIDVEVHKMITEQYERAKALLSAHKQDHAELANFP